MRGRGVGADSLHGAGLKAARYAARRRSHWGKEQPAARGRHDEDRALSHVTSSLVMEPSDYRTAQVWRIRSHMNQAQHGRTRSDKFVSGRTRSFRVAFVKRKRPPAQAGRAHSGGERRVPSVAPVRPDRADARERSRASRQVTRPARTWYTAGRAAATLVILIWWWGRLARSRSRPRPRFMRGSQPGGSRAAALRTGIPVQGTLMARSTFLAAP